MVPRRSGDTHRRLNGTALPDCPCMMSVEAEVSAERNAEKEKADAAQSLLIRITAIENALWGMSYELSLDSGRPALKRDAGAKLCEVCAPAASSSTSKRQKRT
jgi:hypothetical protein